MSKILALIIIALLLLPVQLGIQASSEVDYDVVSLNPDYYAWTRVNVTSDGLLVLMYSTSPLTFMVMTPSQFWQFYFLGQASSLYTAVSSSVDTYIRLAPGEYYLVFYNNVTGSTAYLTYYVFSRPAPTGIVDLGVQYVEGRLVPYKDEFQGVVGIVKFNGLQTGYTFKSMGEIANRAFSIQLNAVVEIRSGSGTQQHWAQNTVSYFDNGYISFVDNLWNVTSPTASINSNMVSGRGQVYFSFLALTKFYGYETDTMKVPPSVELLIHVHRLNAGYVEIQFGYAVGNENLLFGPVNWYDNVTVNVGSPVYSAVIVVDGYSLTGSYNAKATELVFGGFSSGRQANFSRADAQLYLFYYNSTPDGATVFYPRTLFPFGPNTAEGAYDLQTDASGNVRVGFSVPLYIPPPVPPLAVQVNSFSGVAEPAMPTVTLNLSVSGGHPPYRVSLNVYSQDGAPVSSRHGSYQALEPWRLYEFDFGNLPPGNYTVVITVTDSAGATKVVRSVLTVFPELKLSVTGPLTNVDAGQLVTFRARAIGGAPPVSVSWYINGTLVSQGESLVYAFPAPGVYVVTAVATDSLGVKTSSQVRVMVVPALTANLTLSVQGRPLGQPPQTLRVDEGIPLGLNVVTEGGVPPIAVAWYLNRSAIGQGNSIEIPFSEPGTYEVVAVVRDGANYTVPKTFTVIVVPPPKVYVRVLNASGSAFVYNATATLVPGIAGGVNATIYVYLNGQFVGKFSPGQPVTLNLAMGDNAVKIVAVDQYGLNSTYVLTIPSGYTPTFYGVIGGAAAAVLVTALALLKRRK